MVLSLTAHYLNSESAMTVWEFMEMIHSRSYTYIIKNVYSDPSEVFDTILDDENILDRASSVTQSYDDFIELLISMMVVPCGIWQEKVISGQFERVELKRKLYRAVANVNILEGIRFYVSFACSFAFGENKLMESRQRYSLLLLEMKVNIWFSRRIFSTNGETETMQKCKELLEKKRNM